MHQASTTPAGSQDNEGTNPHKRETATGYPITGTGGNSLCPTDPCGCQGNMGINGRKEGSRGIQLQLQARRTGAPTRRPYEIISQV